MFNTLQFYPKFAFQTPNTSMSMDEAIKMSFNNGEHEITICSSFSNHADYDELDLILNLINQELSINKHLDVFVNLNVIPKKESELLYHILFKVSEFNIENKHLNVHCDTNNEEKIADLSAEFERMMSKQVYLDLNHVEFVKSSA